jgi:hypothetical protein
LEDKVLKDVEAVVDDVGNAAGAGTFVCPNGVGALVDDGGNEAGAGDFIFPNGVGTLDDDGGKEAGAGALTEATPKGEEVDFDGVPNVGFPEDPDVPENREILPNNPADVVELSLVAKLLVLVFDLSPVATANWPAFAGDGDLKSIVSGDPNDAGGTILGEGGGSGLSLGLGLDIHRSRFAWNDARSSLVTSAATLGVERESVTNNVIFTVIWNCEQLSFAVVRSQYSK